ncbi:MAG: MFS transporter [Polyangiales bacterium]
MNPSPRRTLAALALLYGAQGVPFGFAAEYLPVILRQSGYTRAQIAALFWLQLPWQLKPLWAGVADRPSVRPRARAALLALQVVLASTMAAYALFPARPSPLPWFALTALAALVAATQDVFVDAFAVRSLSERDRGYGNSAQVAGYRVGIIAGGGGMLVAAGTLGEPVAAAACAGLILAASVGAFALRDDGAAATVEAGPYRTATDDVDVAPGAWQTVRRMLRADTWRVAAVAVTYKLGAHAASTLLKPLLVDAGWRASSIGALVVSLGTGSAVVGSVVGGALHRRLGERAALALAAVAQAVTTLPLILCASRGAPPGLTAAAVAAEHFAGGLATTVLFAALMTATLRSRAGLHYTLLTGLNAAAIGVGGMAGAFAGDLAGPVAGFALAAALCLAPLALLPGWDRHARASAGHSEHLTEMAG